MKISGHIKNGSNIKWLNFFCLSGLVSRLQIQNVKTKKMQKNTEEFWWKISGYVRNWPNYELLHFFGKTASYPDNMPHLESEKSKLKEITNGF